MKKSAIRWSFFCLPLIALMSISVFAHPGRTDGSGGHTNHSTGEYHYHHGYDDHQHYDMNGDGIADCPYDFRDNETKKSSSSESTAKSYTEVEKSSKEEKQDKSSSPSTKQIVGEILRVILFGPLVLYVLACLIMVFFMGVRDLIRKIKRK